MILERNVHSLKLLIVKWQKIEMTYDYKYEGRNDIKTKSQKSKWYKTEKFVCLYGYYNIGSKSMKVEMI